MQKHNMTLEQLIQAKFEQHFQSFVHYVENDIEPEQAWAMIVERTTFGPVLLQSLKEKCFAAVGK